MSQWARQAPNTLKNPRRNRIFRRKVVQKAVQLVQIWCNWKLYGRTFLQQRAQRCLPSQKQQSESIKVDRKRAFLWAAV